MRARQRTLVTTTWQEFVWTEPSPTDGHRSLGPALLRCLRGLPGPILDLGCGNGALTAALRSRLDVDVVGVDASMSGIEAAEAAHPEMSFHRHDLTQPLPPHLQGAFATAIAVEVIEHLLLPRELLRRAMESGATTLVITTPYHGYWKNLALALSNSFDAHWNPLMDYGHVKFFSPRTLSALLHEGGWRPQRFRRIGRVPPLARSMLVVAELADVPA